MAFLRTGMGAFALLTLGAAWSQGQSTHAHVIVEPQGQPRLAGIAPPPAPQHPSANYGPTVFANYPVVVTPDGQVFVDLGYGYEEVARACPYAYGYGCERSAQPIDSQRTVFPSYIAPSYIAPSYDAPRYAPPGYQAPVYPAPPNPVGVYINSVIATARGYVRAGDAAPSRAVAASPGQAPATRLVAAPRATAAAAVAPRHATVHR